jgi:DNA (cytosine-5)-methyltransferase 1
MSDLSVMDWFCGAGGSSQGYDAIPGTMVALAANHDPVSISSHSANFPETIHKIGDIRSEPVWEWPEADLFHASPECTNWTGAKGIARVDDNQPMLVDTRTEVEKAAAAAAERSRALMEEVPYYLEGVISRGGLVKAGLVENVVEARTRVNPTKWDWWVRSFHKMGYKTKLIAFNSMHAQATRTPQSAQSRDRFYFAYWHESLGRDPDWDKWLRPAAWCPSCDAMVHAVQVWRVPGVEMGRYKQSYDYRCPTKTCKGQLVEPATLPAASIIDWSDLGERIGDRKRPLVPNTMRRIRAGIDRYWGNPFITELRGGGSDARPVAEALGTVSTSGNHHYLTTPPALIMRNYSKEGSPAHLSTPVSEPLRTLTTTARQSLLVPYYGNGEARPVTAPVGALSTRDRYALASPAIDINNVHYRMLKLLEIARAMAFVKGYIVLGKESEQKSQYGNAVTPCVTELAGSALVETITGAELERLVVAA